MDYDTETLKQLRISLDEEDDDTSIIPMLENHHKYLKEYIAILTNPNTSNKDKMATFILFMRIFNMHAQAEEETLYNTLKEATNHDLRLEGLKGLDEHEVAYEIANELNSMGCETSWSDEIDAKVRVLSGLIKSHVREEEMIMFPMAEKHIPEKKLINLNADYLEKCKLYLEIEMEPIPSEVSRTDVMTFFY